MYIKLHLDYNNLKKILKELTVKPFIPDDFNSGNLFYKVYKKVGDSYLIPGYYLSGNEYEYIYNETPEINFSFKYKLRDYQKEIGDLVLKELLNNWSGICSLYTGWGKTCLALWLITKLKKKTLIVVHTEALLEQWKEKIDFFLGEYAGTLRQNVCENNNNILIGTVQSILSRDYVLDDIGFLIIDETHHYSTKVFSQLFYKIKVKYSIGLTATLERKDRLEKVVKWFLGEPIVNVKQLVTKPLVDVRYVKYSKLPEEQLNRVGKVNLPKMITDMSELRERNEMIIEIISDLLKENRKILLLSDRRNHCVWLNKTLGNEISGLYLGGMNKEQLDKTNSKNVIIATYQMASEGYDNPTLDTLILSTPKSNIEQCVGRILRQVNTNKALLIDIVDSYSIFNILYFKRIRFYKKKEFKFLKKEIYREEEEEAQDILSFNECLL